MITGVDVSKESLLAQVLAGARLAFANRPSGINKLLSKLANGSIVAMEATGQFHKPLADAAYRRSFQVMVFNPKDVQRYAQSISPRAKTDRSDALVIAQFAAHREHPLYRPIPPEVDRLRTLARARGALVGVRTALGNRLRECSELIPLLSGLTDSVKATIEELDQKLVSAAEQFSQYRFLLSIPGFGPIVSAYMLALLASRTFHSSDAFVAFLGLDLKVRESGKRKGKRCITKRGDPYARALLYIAVWGAIKGNTPFRILYNGYLGRGLSKTAAAVAVARKLSRVAWALYNKEQLYQPERVILQRQPHPQVAPKPDATDTQSSAAQDPSVALLLLRDRLRALLVDPDSLTLLEKENLLVAKHYFEKRA